MTTMDKDGMAGQQAAAGGADEAAAQAASGTTKAGAAQATDTGVVTSAAPAGAASGKPWPKEIGGPTGPEPTRYGDWERNGRCTDF